MDALIAPETVKPAQGTDRNIAIWGALEARLQSVDTLVIGGLNEGVWPREPESRPVHVPADEDRHRPGTAGTAHRRCRA